MTSLQNFTSKQSCGCDQSNLHLHVEIENLKQRLMERERHIVKMETNFLKEAEKFPNGEFAALTEELLTWQDKYSRLFEAHKRVQKVNQGLEDKLLKMVDRCETEKSSLQDDITKLTKKLIDQETNISKLSEENERYRTDLHTAIQLLQCKPSNFLPQKFDMLPPELQAKVRLYVASKQRKLTDGNGNSTKPDVKTIKVPIPTFPPTAMVYSLGSDKETNSNETMTKQNAPVDIVSAAIMAKILKEREKERSTSKHCQTCSCSLISYDNKSCQTDDVPTIDDSCNNNVVVDTINEVALRNRGEKPEPVSSAMKQEPQDLIDLNGYNSDDNYQFFKTIRRQGSQREEAARDLISFESSSPDTVKGPRPCSVRLQPGSNNILLDNAAHFSSPILYKRRPGHVDLSEPSVHRVKTRNSSQSSIFSERKSSTETEI
ncbi:hypothetical protein V9T40_001263 [Parthenolecanium corni]|uniref:Tight junction-associated protein 1 n=1 Tax=Parthenolecanium corni TaxID=536013 RepID=A0AAN9Y171_9HEMI